MAPIIFLMSLIIITLGLIVGRIESWNRFDALYWAFITALTVGYGDISPTLPFTKWFTILYVFVGLAIIGGFIGVIGESVTEHAREERGGDEPKGREKGVRVNWLGRRFADLGAEAGQRARGEAKSPDDK